MKRLKIDEADKVFSKYIRLRDSYTCQRCQSYYPEGKGLYCCHFFGRRNESVRFDPDNCVSLCLGCHKHFDEHDRLAFVEFMRKRLGEKAFNNLRVRKERKVKKDRGMSLIISKELLKTVEK